MVFIKKKNLVIDSYRLEHRNIALITYISDNTFRARTNYKQNWHNEGVGIVK